MIQSGEKVRLDGSYLTEAPRWNQSLTREVAPSGYSSRIRGTVGSINGSVAAD